MNLHNAETQTEVVQKIDEVDLAEFEGRAYHCCAEVHLAKLRPVCALIHPFALRISTNTGVFSGSAISVGRHLGRDEKTIRLGFSELEDYGFFEKEIQGIFGPNSYRVLNHEQWTFEHPGQCVAKVEYPWTDENDPLGQQLWVLSGTRVKWRPFQIAALRKLGLPDEILKAEFAVYYQQQGQRKQARNVSLGFLMYLRRKLKGM